MKTLLILLFNFLFVLIFSQTWEMPDTIKDEIILKHNNYIVSYNQRYKIPNYTIYILTRDKSENDSVKRTNNFISDPLLNKKIAIGPSEYIKSGYDKGHMTPADDMAFSLESMKESFYMTNMCPQKPEFNRGIWKILENYIREICLQYDSVCIITGPIITDNMNTIGNNVGIPNHFFKVIYIYKLETSVGFFFENEKYTSQKNIHPFVLMRQYQTTVDEIEELSGLNFFIGLPKDKIQEVKFNKKLNLD